MNPIAVFARFASMVLGVVVIGIGIASANYFFDAASRLSESGFDLLFLRSVSGDTVAEAYYQEIGRYGIAYAKVAHGLGLLTLVFSIGLGSIMIFLPLQVAALIQARLRTAPSGPSVL